MNEMWFLLLLVPVLAWVVLSGIRARRRPARTLPHPGPDHVTAAEMSRLIRELSPELRPSARVTSPSLTPESNHVWDSPSGKRVYIN